MSNITLTSEGRTITIQQTGQPGRGIPAGGTTGQVLAKATGTDYDTEWVTGGAGGGGSSTFIGLTDTPGAFVADRIVTVNAAGDALEFPTASAARTLLGLGTAALDDTGDFATAAQGTLAGTAVQPGDLASVATSGAYSDLTGLPTLFSGAYGDLTGVPATFAPSAHTHTLANITDAGTAAASDTGDFAAASHTHTASQVTDFNTAADARANARIAAASIGDLANVNLTGLASGKILEYNGSAFVLIDTPSGGGGASSLGALSDVTITSASAGQVLRWNGSGWVNATLAYADISGTPTLATVATSGAYSDLTGIPATFAPAAHTLQSHSNVTIGTPTTTSVLAWSGSAWTDQDINTFIGSYLMGTAELGDLSDVSVFGLAAGHTIRWNGSNWSSGQLGYADLSGTPTLATVATSGDYDDLINLPSLFSGAYGDLSGVPSTFAPSAHTLGSHSNVSAGADAAGAGNFLKWTGIAWDDAALAAEDIKSGVFANARIAESNVTQHEAALAILGSQVSGKQGPGAAFDGSGAVLTSGVIVRSPVTEAGTVTACYADADASGSVDVIVRRYAAADTTFATPAALGTLSISSAAKGSLTGLSQAVAVGDTLEFELSGTIATIERLAVRSRI